MFQHISRWLRKFASKDVADEMKTAERIGNAVNQAVEWLEDRALLLVSDYLWTKMAIELGYSPELMKKSRDAPKSGFYFNTGLGGCRGDSKSTKQFCRLSNRG